MAQAAAVSPGPLLDTAHDPTVCDPVEMARIQAHYGVNLEDLDPQMLAHLVDRSRHAGNEAFKDKRYKEAVRMYSQAIAGAPQDHKLYGNRSAAHLALGQYEEAAWDARKAAVLAPDWPKACYRLGCALLGLSQWAEAEAVLQRGLSLDPSNPNMAAKQAEAAKRARADAAARQAQAGTERRGIVAQMRAARRQDTQQAMVNQFKQAMTAPDWEVEDLEWRPTYLPAMRLKRQDPAAFLANPMRRSLAALLAALADLSQPKQALRVLEDEPRLQAYQAGMAAALRRTGRDDAHVLVLSGGGGLLPLLAAAAGARSVTAVERGRMLYRMAKQCLEANSQGPHARLAARVQLLDRRLQAVGVQGEAPPPDVVAARQLRSKLAAAQRAAGRASPAGAEGEDDDDDGLVMPQRASLLITDLLDHGVLGAGLLPALDYAADRLLELGALVVPSAVKVFGVLLELRVGKVSGFDLSPLDAYWWHPSAERLDLSRLPHRRLSAPFLAHTLDLQARLEARQGGQGPQAAQAAPAADGEAEAALPDGRAAAGPGAAAEWELDQCLEVPIIAGGRWNAVAFWFEADMVPGEDAPVLTSWGKDGSAPCLGPPTQAEAAAQAAAGEAQGAQRAQRASSWDPAVQFVDAQEVAAGATVSLRVRQDSGQFVFTTTPPQCRPRHALVPRWHFDMVLDAERNAAYDAAIRRAVQRRREQGCGEVLALDLGAGAALLSMMAARAGAASVYGVEHTAHMCDCGEEAAIMNGFMRSVVMLDRDARRLDVFRKPDGMPPDLPRPADLLVFEVFDSGCIGEGVLHILAAAQAKVVAGDAAQVPIAATVFCQPIQMRLGQVLGFDCSQANRWRWRPDYEGVELGTCRDKWRALGEAREVFHFDLRNAAAYMGGGEARLRLRFTEAGVFNAVAMWFDLQLDEHTSLSTSPHAGKGLTWQQAVQYVPEVQVQAGHELDLLARHDSYSISYALPPELSHNDKAQPAGGPQSAAAVQEQQAGLAGDDAPAGVGPPDDQPRLTGVPVVDPAWKVAFEQMQEVSGQLAKSCVQNPLEYRAVAEAAVRMAARPHDLGVDAQQAAEFCVRMMG